MRCRKQNEPRANREKLPEQRQRKTPALLGIWENPQKEKPAAGCAPCAAGFLRVWCTFFHKNTPEQVLFVRKCGGFGSDFRPYAEFYNASLSHTAPGFWPVRGIFSPEASAIC